MNRGALIQLRRELVEKITETMLNTKLFDVSLAYPKRYFDDLVINQQKEQHKAQSRYDNTIRGLTGSQTKLDQLLK